jgi:hypothetical protein
LPSDNKRSSITLAERFVRFSLRVRLLSCLAAVSPLLLLLQRPLLPLLRWSCVFCLGLLQLSSLLHIAFALALPSFSRTLLFGPRARCLGQCLARSGWGGEDCLRCTVCRIARACLCACFCPSPQCRFRSSRWRWAWGVAIARSASARWWGLVASGTKSRGRAAVSHASW